MLFNWTLRCPGRSSLFILDKIAAIFHWSEVFCSYQNDKEGRKHQLRAPTANLETEH